ncbi:LysR family transcriptional regulator [Halomonas sp. NCCP-2165]|nr:LysR family transcriptional regulator [Halomonas sp. NCCP-2165]GKW48882.1 LysR family transcriptional regulator [Halomonas sp. NCCP-2165]
MRPAVSFRQLRVFVAVARLGTLSAAARELCLSPSATSEALAELERRLGVALFDRPGRRLTLNALGQELLPRAERLLEGVEEFVATAREPEGELRGRLVVSASATVGTYLLPGLAGRFNEAHPGAELRLRLRNSREVIDEVLRLEADLGLIEGECREPSLISEPWCEDRLVIVASPRHALAAMEHLDDAALARGPWILREPGSGTRAVFEAAMRGRALTPRVAMELGQHEAIKQAVRAGLGLGCLSEFCVAGELARGELVALSSDLGLRRRFSLIWHPRRYRSPLWQAFKVALRDHGAGSLAAPGGA